LGWSLFFGVSLREEEGGKKEGVEYMRGKGYGGVWVGRIAL